MAVMQTLLILLSISFVIGEDTEWNSPNVSACFNVPDVAIDFVYTPSGGDSSFLLVSWHRKVVSQGSVEESIAELDDDGKFLVLPNTALVGRLNKTGEFGLLISNPTTGDSGEYSIKLRTKTGRDKTGIGMLKITDPCIKQEEVNKCKKVTCESSQTNPKYVWTGPKNNTEETITICEGDSGTYTCCVTTSSTNCIMAKITAPNGTGSPGSDFGPIIGAVVGCVVLIIVAVLVACILYRKKKAEKSNYHAAATGEQV